MRVGLLVGALVASLLVAAAPADGQVIRTAEVVQCSGSIAVANTSQVATNGDSSRVWLIVENPTNATEPLFVSVGPGNPASTAAGSIELAIGGSLSFLSGVSPTGQINVTAATAGHRFICAAGR
jgi:hypothetical protein